MRIAGTASSLSLKPIKPLATFRKQLAFMNLCLRPKRHRPVFHHFADEIKDRLKRIYCYALAYPVHIESIPNNLEKIRALKLSKRETAWVYKKLAEFYCEINWLAKAQEMLRMALKLHPPFKRHEENLPEIES